MAKKKKLGSAKTQREAAWAVRGISFESRNAAKMAARRHGQTLGKWLDRVIREHAHADYAVPARTEDVRTEIDDLKIMVKHLVEFQQKPKSGFFRRLFL